MDQLENKYEDDVVEIDLKQLLLKLKQYWYVLVACQETIPLLKIAE